MITPASNCWGTWFLKYKTKKEAYEAKFFMFAIVTQAAQIRTTNQPITPVGNLDLQ